MNPSAKEIPSEPQSVFPPATPTMKKAIALAGKIAREAGDEFVSSDHLIVGCLRVSQGVAVNEIAKLGVEPDALAETILHALHPEKSAPTTLTALRSSHPILHEHICNLERSLVEMAKERDEVRACINAIGRALYENSDNTSGYGGEDLARLAKKRMGEIAGLKEALSATSRCRDEFQKRLISEVTLRQLNTVGSKLLSEGEYPLTTCNQ